MCKKIIKNKCNNYDLYVNDKVTAPQFESIIIILSVNFLKALIKDRLTICHFSVGSKEIMSKVIAKQIILLVLCQSFKMITSEMEISTENLANNRQGRSKFTLNLQNYERF